MKKLQHHIVPSPENLDRLNERILVLEEENSQLARDLDRSDIRFHDLADNIPEVISIFEPNLKHQIFISFAYEGMWEKSRKSLYDNPLSWLDVVHADDLPRVRKTLDSFEAAASDSRGSDSPLSVENFKDEFRIIRGNGDYRWMRARYSPIRDENKKILRVISFIEDITDWKKLETQLIQSQKMDAVGRLAGGIAHDFNNLLTVINGYSALLGERLDLAEDVQEDLKSIRKAGDRAAALTSQLLAFSRKAMLQSKVIELNRAITNVEPLLRRLIRENVELNTFLQSDPMNVKTDPIQLEQVIMNLVINARDAIESTGTITIETAKVRFDVETARLHGNSPPGDYAMLAVSDTGKGMSLEVQERIFEPFFTTKELNQGTGLGLATVYGIVKQSRGTILVYSEQGSGTTIKVYLPLANPPTKVDIERVAQKACTGTGTILLVEDDEQVRHIAREVLKKRGYDVIAAANGEEATEMAKSLGRIDLLVTDVIMPKMGGRELAEKMAAKHPAMKVLFISGYTENAAIQIASLSREIHHLAKPFSPDALGNKVSQLLVQKTMTA